MSKRNQFGMENLKNESLEMTPSYKDEIHELLYAKCISIQLKLLYAKLKVNFSSKSSKTKQQLDAQPIQ